MLAVSVGMVVVPLVYPFGIIGINNDIVFQYGMAGYAFDGFTVLVQRETFGSEGYTLVCVTLILACDKSKDFFRKSDNDTTRKSQEAIGSLRRVVRFK